MACGCRVCAAANNTFHASGRRSGHGCCRGTLDLRTCCCSGAPIWSARSNNGLLHCGFDRSAVVAAHHRVVFREHRLPVCVRNLLLGGQRQLLFLVVWRNTAHPEVPEAYASIVILQPERLFITMWRV